MTMDWFVRFSLGLPARFEDAVALQKTLPELESRDFRLQNRPCFWPLFTNYNTNEELLKALQRWAYNVESKDDLLSVEYRNCPSYSCPLRAGQLKANRDDSQFAVALMVAAGGPKAKPPRDCFLDLVKRTHPENDPPREVILTDPYIYSDTGEDGHNGGFSNLVAYLEALRISANDSFSISMTPSPKRGTVTAKKSLHRYLKTKYKNIQIKNYSPQLKFHDRFYVVRHKSENIRGVFGPSINGLTSDTIVLMGDIQELQPLKKLEFWFG